LGVFFSRPRVYALVCFFVLLRRLTKGGAGGVTPFVPLDDVSVVSRSKLFDAAEGVLEPVIVGD
jgi:hypothetical protein